MKNRRVSDLEMKELKGGFSPQFTVTTSDGPGSRRPQKTLDLCAEPYPGTNCCVANPT